MKAYKNQKLGEGIEWDSDKVVMVEHVRRKLAEKWPADFGRTEPTRPETPLEQMSKEEYQRYSENLKMDRECIGDGYRRVFNKLKTMKQKFASDTKNSLRSGAGQVTTKFWEDCNELWGGSAGTEPLKFGVDTSGSCTEHLELDSLCDEENEGHTGTIDSESVSELETSVDSESSSVDSEVKVQKNTKKRGAQLIDNKRQKLQKKLTQQGKQDVLLQMTQKQTEIQESLLVAMNRKDEGVDAALKSMAESSALLNKTLAMGMNMLFTTMQQQQPYQDSQPGSQRYPPQYPWSQPQQQPASFQSSLNTFQTAPYQQVSNPVNLQRQSQVVQPEVLLYANEEPSTPAVIHYLPNDEV